jgi:hypothetical protein
MKPFVAIVKSTAGELDKYQDFDLEADAASHVATYGGFVVPDPGGQTSYWVIDEAAKTVANDQVQADADALANSWDRFRRERDALLVSSDWSQGNDSPLTDEVKTSWATYRQELRDLPETYSSDPNAVVWPEAPE